MVSRKWLYSYRILTARLHEGEPMHASWSAGFDVGSAEPQPLEISVDDELTESQPAKPALMLTAGRKT
jgi:hypothetical protein